MTAKKAGTTTVRCKMPNGTQATCNVTVKPLATSLKLNASEIVLYIGQSFDINSSVPKGTAAYYRLYSSSNSKIAAVTRGGGVVKGVATGKATVTCTLNNGKKSHFQCIHNATEQENFKCSPDWSEQIANRLRNL